MNFNRVHFIMLFTVLIVIAYIFITKPSKLYRQNANILFHEIINRDIDKLSIVINRDDDYSYLLITDKIIIKEFMKAIKNDTYIPASPTGQYNYRYAVSLHDKQNSNLLLLRSDTYNDSINNDSVEMIFFDVRNIDVLNVSVNSPASSISNSFKV